MTTMKPRRYLFAIVDGGGNVPPELAAARRLVERGHEVTVLGEDSISADVHATGARFRRWVRAPNRPDRRPENDPTRDWECSNPLALISRVMEAVLVGPAARYADEVGENIGLFRPDLVVCSMFCVGGMVAAEAAGTPFVVLFPNVYLLPAEGLPAFGIGLKPARGLLGRWRDRALNTVIERVWNAKGLPGLNALRAQHRLPPLSRFLDQTRNAWRQLILTSPDFDFPGALPAGARYVGPVLDDPVWAQAEPWTPPAGGKPLVLVAMSSTFQDQVACLQRVVDALGTLPVQALVTTGPALQPGMLHPSDNVHVVARAPHNRVLPHAAVVVTHGGHGTVMKALAANVPLVLLPHGRDQPDTAVRVASRGAGVVLKRTAGSHAIAAAVRRMMEDDSCRAAARRLGEVIRRDAATTALEEQLEHLPGRAHPRSEPSRTAFAERPRNTHLPTR